MKRILPIVTSLLLFLFAVVPVFADNDYHLQAHPGSENGTVTLTWQDRDFVDTYNIAYGEQSGHYNYGVTDIGKVASYTIGGLVPGQTYYFVISPVDNEEAQAYALEASAQASGTQAEKTYHEQEAVHTTTTEQTAVSAMPAHQENTEMSIYNDENKNFHLTARPGSETGTVTLTWDNKGYVDNYSIVYGPSQGNYIWGVSHIGEVGEYTVGALTPGQTYYFAISAVDDEVALPFSPGTHAVAAH